MPYRIDCIDVSTQEGMLNLEKRITEMLNCSDGKCSFLRTRSFVNFRLKALYAVQIPEPVVIYGEGLKVILTKEKKAELFMDYQPVDPDIHLGDSSASAETTKKRKACANSDEEED